MDEFQRGSIENHNERYQRRKGRIGDRQCTVSHMSRRFVLGIKASVHIKEAASLLRSQHIVT